MKQILCFGVRVYFVWSKDEIIILQSLPGFCGKHKMKENEKRREKNQFEGHAT
jgi:hypothetical protein